MLKLKTENKYVAGLDTNCEAYESINRELKHRIAELFKRYDFPSKKNV